MTEPLGDAERLAEVLARARKQGFLGPAPVEEHIGHAEAFVAVLAERARAAPLRTAVDLGTGGGVPGLAGALAYPAACWVFVEASSRRAAFLEEAARPLGLGASVEVIAARAEDVGRDPGRRGVADAVTARSFGAPAVTAECAAPLLRVGGSLLVSDPPGGGDAGRWDERGLAVLGLHVVERRPGPPALTILEQAEPCPPRWSRRTGIPSKRPLW
ncbi:hypothetical protein BH18ACT1_BH18ACT1_19210 [soil metagenome]